MAFCSKCGTSIPDDVQFCTHCGTPQQKAGGGQVPPAGDPDIQKNKALAVLCYIGLFLFVPLVAANDSPFVRFHLNNGLWLTISYLICACVPIVGWLACVVLFVFNIMGIVRAAQGRYEGLPVLGSFVKFFK